MIHHIVMFKITKFDDEQDKVRKTEELKSTFEKLKGKIKSVKSFEVGININTSSCAYDVVINSTFRTLDDLNTYIMHPDHQYAIEKISTIPKSKIVVDYESTRSRK
ncbi:MAG: Dabb family protein [Bacteroidales bacterium]|nr:MAG: Dabb family protein [Bacteroidales bacterium]